MKQPPVLYAKPYSALEGRQRAKVNHWVDSRLRRYLLGEARRWLGARAELEDCVQRTLTQCLPTHDPTRGTLPTFCVHHLRNYELRALRRTIARENGYVLRDGGLELPDPSGLTPEHDAATREVLHCINPILRRVSAVHHLAFLVHAVEDVEPIQLARRITQCAMCWCAPTSAEEAEAPSQVALVAQRLGISPADFLLGLELEGVARFTELAARWHVVPEDLVLGMADLVDEVPPARYLRNVSARAVFTLKDYVSEGLASTFRKRIHDCRRIVRTQLHRQGPR